MVMESGYAKGLLCVKIMMIMLRSLVLGRSGCTMRLSATHAANAKYRSMRKPDPPTVYKMMDPSQGAERPILMHVRTRGAPAAIITAVRRARRPGAAGGGADHRAGDPDVALAGAPGGPAV